MKVLFVISIAALLALLWAAFSIAQHVRRARRRKHVLAERGIITEARPPKTDPVKPFVERRAATGSPLPLDIERRADWAYFNKDMGDLSDPYEDRRRKPRTPPAR